VILTGGLNMKVFKRILCLAIVVLMLFSMAACGGSANKSSQSGSSSSTGSTSSSGSTGTTSGTTGSSQQKPADGGQKEYEHVVINLATIQAQDGYDYTKGDPFAQYYSDMFNYTLNVTALAWDNWNERLRIWINAGDMPDVAVYNFIFADAAGYVEQELLKKLPDDWKTRWPNVAKVYEATQLGPEMEKRFGGTYFLPRARFFYNAIGDPLPDHWSLYMRKDWAEAINFPIKTTYTISEVIDFAKQIKASDPGNLGDNLIPLAVQPHSAVELFVYRNSTYYNSFYKDPNDGLYKWGAASVDTLEGLKLFAEAYQAGVLFPEFYTLPSNEDTRQFDTQGIAASNFGQAPTAAVHTNLVNNFQQNLNLDPFECVNMATILGEDGNYHQRDLINFWGAVIFSPNVDDKVFERWMDVLDYNASDEGRITLNLGLKDIDWTYDSDGSLKSLHDVKKQPLGGPNGKYPSMGYTLGAIILFDDFAFDNPNNDPRAVEMSRTLYRERCQIATAATFPKIDWDLYCFDSPSMRKVQFDYDTELCSLVLMEGDIETNWRNWVESKMPLIEPVLEELNSQLR